MPSPVVVFCAVSRTLTEYQPPTLPSLGDALAVRATAACRAPELVAAAVGSAPWCAVVLLQEQPLSARETETLLPLLPHHPAFVAGGGESDPTRICASIANRATPSRSDVAAYLRLRRAPRDLIAAVEDALASTDTDTDTDTPKLAHAPHSSSINRRLAAFGPLRARGWRALFRLLQVTITANSTIEQAAWEAGIDPRTLRTLTQELLGLAPGPTLDTPGWEWQLEAALRRHGYLTWPSLTRRSSAWHAVPALQDA